MRKEEEENISQVRNAEDLCQFNYLDTNLIFGKHQGNFGQLEWKKNHTDIPTLNPRRFKVFIIGVPTFRKNGKA